MFWGSYIKYSTAFFIIWRCRLKKLQGTKDLFCANPNRRSVSPAYTEWANECRFTMEKNWIVNYGNVELTVVTTKNLAHYSNMALFIGKELFVYGGGSEKLYFQSSIYPCARGSTVVFEMCLTNEFTISVFLKKKKRKNLKLNDLTGIGYIM